jgi:Polyketide cyclase / dehydrase and lipid transport
MFLLSVSAQRDYRLPIFLFAPLVMGATTAWWFARRSPLTSARAAGMGAEVILIGAVLLFFVALEGGLCIAMALPLAVPLGAVGGLIGRWLAQSLSDGPAAVGLLCAPLVIAAQALGLAPAASNPPPLREVLTTVDIEAPPERVWEHVLAFPDLPPPSEWFLRHGIAYPVRARIDGTGVGAVRRCEFSTGTFVEPITTWDAPSRLAFDVSSQPVPMTEWNPWGAIDAPHLHGTLRSQRGEFRLIALPGGRTRLEGRTWYALDMAPQAYWTLWSDMLIHAIHGRVLRHIAALAEADAR